MGSTFLQGDLMELKDWEISHKVIIIKIKILGTFNVNQRCSNLFHRSIAILINIDIASILKKQELLGSNGNFVANFWTNCG